MLIKIPTKPSLCRRFIVNSIFYRQSKIISIPLWRMSVDFKVGLPPHQTKAFNCLVSFFFFLQHPNTSQFELHNNAIAVVYGLAPAAAAADRDMQNSRYHCASSSCSAAREWALLAVSSTLHYYIAGPHSTIMHKSWQLNDWPWIRQQQTFTSLTSLPSTSSVLIVLTKQEGYRIRLQNRLSNRGPQSQVSHTIQVSSTRL